jgi:hypothetical protein
MIRRRRRPDDGRYTPSDAACWARLAEVAIWAAGNPSRYGAALEAAGRRASRAVPPPGGRSRSGPFVQLILLSQTVAPAPERLLLLAEEIEAAIRPPPAAHWVEL